MSKRVALASLIVLVALGFVGFVAVANKVSFQPQPSYTSSPTQMVLLIHDSTDDVGQELRAQVVAALDYAKIAHDDVDLAGGAALPSLEDYTAVVVAAESISRLSEEEALELREYTADGGGLAVLTYARHPVLDEVFGLAGQTSGEATVGDGIHFVGDLAPGLEGLRVTADDLGDFTAQAVETSANVEALAVTEDGSLPLVWRHRFGAGRVVYWNNDLLASKPFRGLAVQSVMDVHGGAAMSLVNVGIFQVDGFPAPPPAGVADATDFIYRQWFPDMFTLARRHDVKYTWLAAFDRGDRAEPPWDFAAWEEASIEIEGHEAPFCAYMAYQAERSGHELALQGYGSQPLLLDRWGGSAENVEAALGAIAQRWQDDSLGAPPTSCTPPGGYDEEGLAALHAALPSVEAIGSDAFGVFEQGGDVFGAFEQSGGREFGPEPWNEALFAIPRWTGGYTGDSYTRLLALSELNTFGVWTHHVRLDDALDVGGETAWRGDGGQYAQLDDLLSWNAEHYPWLRWLTTADACAELQEYLDTDAAYTFDEAYQVTITFSGRPTYVLLRLNDGRKLDMNGVTNAQIVSYYEGEGYFQYVLKPLGQEVRLGLLIPAGE